MEDYSDFKRVEFDTYCEVCKYFDKDALDWPCNICLANSLNFNSNKPIKWEKKDGQRRDKS